MKTFIILCAVSGTALYLLGSTHNPVLAGFVGAIAASPAIWLMAYFKAKVIV